ncbi:hypothetical protein ACFD2S_000601 [Listeria monocytogenes]|uniref:Uncharacterized protein n=1 Tax=Candidatus Enterococcus mansonii TaxID=1834181 RepID=A0A242CGB1_9ENTE|nr:hypothetical protein [Enterococcus sp. 4G2_DIV0659]EAH2108460.1 hypothetical protein [Listeria monocytogenes]EKL6214532.1 hypothetical protein [Listeria monocytogenes]MBV1611113.1 hypothetical protein [Listeria monocytogenes]NVR76538.1 hypothetical protein [Listeria monocytogenes]NVR79711.1 hypothetical protein [Listeria monocytogenes]
MGNQITFDIRKLNDIYSDYTPALNRVGHSFSPDHECEAKEFKISTGDLRDFIDSTFNISMSIDYSHNRNQLNKLVKQVAETTRAKKTFLDQKQFIELITKTEFVNFINKNFDQEHTFKKSFPIRAKEFKNLQRSKLIMDEYLINSTENISANYLSFFSNFVNDVKNLYVKKINEEPLKKESPSENFRNKVLNEVIDNERTRNTSSDKIKNESNQATIIRFLQDIKSHSKKR